jgi:hypothetical protein
MTTRHMTTTTNALVQPALNRVDAIFRAALVARRDGSGAGAGNLYAGSEGPEAMLAAFRLLAEGTPLIRFGHVGANRIIDGVTRDREAIHVVDIGIGHGIQWDDLLARMATRPLRPRLRLTGVDLASPGSNPAAALERTGARLSALADRLGIDFRFEPHVGCVEDLERPRTDANEDLVVNAALALHHVADGDAVIDPARGRRAVLRRLATWKPSLLTLIEPDAGHNDVAFPERLREARRHYGLVFDVFAHLFPHDPAERTTLERRFFGSEILNVVASEGHARVERHDRIRTWCRRMEEAGFAPLSLGALAPSHEAALGLQPPFTVELRKSAMALCFGGRSLLGVSAWRS